MRDLFMGISYQHKTDAMNHDKDSLQTRGRQSPIPLPCGARLGSAS